MENNKILSDKQVRYKIIHGKISLQVCRHYAPEIYLNNIMEKAGNNTGLAGDIVRSSKNGVVVRKTFTYESLITTIISGLEQDIRDIKIWQDSSAANKMDTDVFAFIVDAQQFIEDWRTNIDFIEKHWTDEK